eukprot:5656538-Amphidinium_carterae.1
MFGPGVIGVGTLCASGGILLITTDYPLGKSNSTISDIICGACLCNTSSPAQNILEQCLPHPKQF